eukprot:956670_1
MSCEFAVNCVERGSHLASIHDEDEFTAAQMLCVGEKAGGIGCWIGLSTTLPVSGASSVWENIDGTPFDYGDDGSGEQAAWESLPWTGDALRMQSTEACVHIASHLGATWKYNNLNCGGPHSNHALCNHNILTDPTKKPSYLPITERPTSDPTKRPTSNPSKTPTAKPTTPSPTQPETMTCGESTVGTYSNAGDPLIFEVRMPFIGELIFDASNSNFAITGIDAKTKLGTYLGTE